jgi:hypothetical protein
MHLEPQGVGAVTKKTSAQNTQGQEKAPTNEHEGSVSQHWTLSKARIKGQVIRVRCDLSHVFGAAVVVGKDHLRLEKLRRPRVRNDRANDCCPETYTFVTRNASAGTAGTSFAGLSGKLNDSFVPDIVKQKKAAVESSGGFSHICQHFVATLNATVNVDKAVVGVKFRIAEGLDGRPIQESAQFDAVHVHDKASKAHCIFRLRAGAHAQGKEHQGKEAHTHGKLCD